MTTRDRAVAFAKVLVDRYGLSRSQAAKTAARKFGWYFRTPTAEEYPRREGANEDLSRTEAYREGFRALVHAQRYGAAGMGQLPITLPLSPAEEAAIPEPVRQVQRAISPWLWLLPLGVGLLNWYRIRRIYRKLKLHE